MICPLCNVDLEGGLVWQTGYEFALEGKHYEQKGVPTSDVLEAEKMADKYAQAYGATRTEGRWGRQIAIYDMEKDRTVQYKCPDCQGVWPR